jgi:hypothetical protein
VTSKWHESQLLDIAKQFGVQVIHGKTRKPDHEPFESKAKFNVEARSKRSGKKYYKPRYEAFGLAKYAADTSKSSLVTLVGSRYEIFSVKKLLQNKFDRLYENESDSTELDRYYELENQFNRSKYYFF